MVSVVSGNGLGLSNTSKELIGAGGGIGDASSGRAGEQVSVNAATGNLVVQDRDEFLVGVGPDVDLLRTYNSQAGWDGDNADGWRIGYYRRVSALAGGSGVNTAGSTVRRTAADGLESVYSFDVASGSYIGTDGAGTYDSLRYDAANRIWTWTDGDSGVTERYAEAGSGLFRLDRVTDAEGHSVHVGYDAAGLITTLSTWKKGATSADETVTLTYDNGSSKHLLQVSSSYLDEAGVQRTRTRTRYEYDAAGRLSVVRTDLSPEDNSILDGRSYWVRYGYDAGGRVNHVEQTDGSSLDIEYDAAGRVTKVTDALGRVTGLAYDAANHRTTVTDALNQATVLGYDGANRLTEISGAATGSFALKQRFAYDTDGNLLSSTNPAGQATGYTYDAHGALVRRLDAAGNLTTWTYDANNLLTSQTSYLTPDADGAAGPLQAGDPVTQRFIYETVGGERRLRFELSAEGRVTQHEYNGLGQRIASTSYTSAYYIAGANPTLADISAWAAGLPAAQRATAERTEFAYDLRGQLAGTKTFATATVNGTAVTYGLPSQQQYVRDAFGRLLQTIDAAGSVTQHLYDGMGRATLDQDATGAITLHLYDDAGRQTLTRSVASGIGGIASNRVEVYDKGGNLTSTLDGAATQALQNYFFINQPADPIFAGFDRIGSSVTYVPANPSTFDFWGRVSIPTGNSATAGENALVQSAAQRFGSGLTFSALVKLPTLGAGQDFSIGIENDTQTRYHRAVVRDGELFAQWVDASGTAHEQKLSTAARPLQAGMTYYVDVETGDTGSVLYVYSQDRRDGFVHIDTTADWGTARERISAKTSPGRAVYDLQLSQLQVMRTAAAGAVLQDHAFDVPGSASGLQGWPASNSLFTQDATGLQVDTRHAGLNQAEQTLLGDAVYPPPAWGDYVTLRTEVTTSASSNGRNLRLGAQSSETAGVAHGLAARFLGGDLWAEYRDSSDGHWVQIKLSNAAHTLKDGTTYIVEITPSNSGASLTVYEKGRSASDPGAFQYQFNEAGWPDARMLITAFGDQAAPSAVCTIGRIQELWTGSSGSVSRTQYAYDALGRLRFTQNEAYARHHLLYDTAGRKVADIDPTGRLTESIYDAAGRLVQTIEYAQRLDANTLGYMVIGTGTPADTQLADIRPAFDAKNRRTTYFYDPAGRLLAVADASGAVTETLYDGASRVTGTIEYWQRIGPPFLDTSAGNVVAAPAYFRPQADAGSRDRVTRNFYGADGLLLGTLDAEGYLTTWEYDAARRKVAQTRHNQLTPAEARATGTLSQVEPARDLEDLRTLWFYDNQGLLAAELDDNGYLTTYDHDANGRVVTISRYLDTARLTVTAGSGGAVQYLSAQGLSAASLVPSTRAEVQTRAYTRRGELAQEVAANGRITRYTYDALGNRTSVVEQDGWKASTSQFWYDELGRVINEMSAAGKMTIHSFGFGNKEIFSRDGLGNVTQRFFDAANRVVFSIAKTPQGNEVTEYEYDAFGEVVRTVKYANRLSDATLNQMGAASVTQGALDRVHALSDPARDEVRSFEYDAVGRVIAQRSGANPASTYHFDSFGDMDRETLAGMGQEIFIHDRLGRLVIHSQSSLGPTGGWLTQTRYDAFGRVIERRDELNHATFTHYLKNDGTPDGGRQIVITDAMNASHTVVYDAIDRVLRETDPLGHSITYTHDSATRTMTMRTSEGLVTTTVYTAQGQVLSITDPTRATTTYAYDADNRLLTTTDALGNVSANTYDSEGRLLSSTTGLKSNGEWSSPTNDGSAVTTSYSYDAANRVLVRQVVAGGLSLKTSYEYDGIGRAVKSTAPDGTVTRYEFDDKGQLKTQVVDDGPGGLKLTTAYTYDAAGHTLTVTEGAGTAASKVTEYRYDPDTGWRTAEIVDPAGLQLTTRYDYDRNGQVIAKHDASGSTTRFFYDQAGRQVFTIDASGHATERLYDAAGRLTGTREYATPLKQNHAARLWFDTGTGTALTRSLGRFAAGDVVTLTLRFKAEAGSAVALLLGDLAGSDPGDNTQTTVVQGTRDGDGWQMVTLTHTMSHDDDMWVSLSGDAGSVGDSVLFDDVAVSSAQRGTVVTDNFEAGVGSAWSSNGLAAETILSDVDLSGSLPLRIQPITSDFFVSWLRDLFAPLADPQHDRLTQYAYDRDGRQVYAIDASGAVTESKYNGAGHVIETVRYATPVPGVWTEASRPVLDPVHDRHGYTVYDAVGQARFSIDALGYVTESIYDRGGRVVALKQYAMKPALPAAMTEDDMARAAAAARDPVHDRFRYYAYDAAGRQRFEVDAEGYVTERRYDALGHVSAVLRHATQLHLDAAPALADVDAALRSITSFDTDMAGITGTAGTWQAGHVTLVSQPEAGGSWAVSNGPRELRPGSSVQFELTPNDIQNSLHAGIEGRSGGAGRLVSLWKPDGHVWAQTYDGEVDLGAYRAGTTYVVEITTSGSGGTLYVHAKDSPRETGYIYRAEAGFPWTTFGLMFATARQPGLPGTTTATLDNIEERDATVSSSRYDAAGRLVDEVDADGNVTHYGYDAAGRLVDTTFGYGRPEASTRHKVYDTAGRVVEQTEGWGTAAAGTTRYRYDVNGQLVATIDPRGVALSSENSAWAQAERVRQGWPADAGALSAAQKQLIEDAYATRYGYDVLGRRTTVIDSLGGTTRQQYDAFGNVVATTDARGGTSYTVYDALDHALQRVDAGGYLTVNAYDSFGNVVDTWKYASRVERADGKPVTIVAAGGTPPPAGAYLVENAALTAHTHITFSARDERTSIVDAEGYVESTSFDAFGDAQTATNKLGGAASFRHDRLGRLIEETQPVKSRNAAGVLVDVVNQYTYDARGNRTRVTEAVGLPEQRVTQYTYDGSGHLLQEIGEAIQVYTVATGMTTVTPVKSYAYDALGRQVEKRDATGATVRSYYDAQGRHVAELAETSGGFGQLQTWSYDPAGQVIAISTWGDLLPVASAGRTQPPAPLNPANVRTTFYAYDAAGRQVAEQVRGVTVGAFTADPKGFDIFTADLTTAKAYDAAGNLVKETDRRGNVTFTWYDALGRKVLQVDRELYVTRWSYDDGAVTELHYARPLTVSPQTTADPATLVPTLDPANDRITTSVLDRLGRVVERRVANVVYGSFDDPINYRYDPHTGDAVTRMQLDGMGNLLRQTDADGRTLDAAFDKLGRRIAQSTGSYTGSSGSAVQQRTATEYNGLGLVVRETQYDADDTTSSGDRVSVYSYNRAGLRTLASTPGGATEMLYDAAGHLTSTLQNVRNADGGWKRQGERIEVDRLGREVSRATVSALFDAATQAVVGGWTVENLRETRYNSFGDITGRRLNGGGAEAAWQEWAEYDNAGRMVRSNSAEGVVKLNVYDQNGNATLTYESTGAVDFGQAGFDLAQARTAAAGQTALSITVYDRRDQVVKHIQPDFTIDNVMAAIDRQTTDIVGGSHYTPITVVPTSSNAQAPSTGGTTALGHVHATSVPPGTQLAANLSVTVQPVITGTGIGSMGSTTGYWQPHLGALSVPLPNLGWYGEGDFEVEYTDSSGFATTGRAAAGASFVNLDLGGRTASSVSLKVYKWLDTNQRVLVASGSATLPTYGSWLSQGAPSAYTGPLYFNLATVAKREFQIAGQPASATSLVFEVLRNGSQVWETKTATLAGQAGQPVAGWFVVDGASLADGSYQFRYKALDASGNTVNQGTGVLDSSASGAAIAQSASVSGSTPTTGVGGGSSPQITRSVAPVAAIGLVAGQGLSASFSGTNDEVVISTGPATVPSSDTAVNFVASTLTVSLPALQGLDQARYVVEFIGHDDFGRAYSRSSSPITTNTASTTLTIASVVQGAYTINVYAVDPTAPGSTSARTLVAQVNGNQPRGAGNHIGGTNYTIGQIIRSTPATVNTALVTQALPKQLLIKTPTDASYTFDRVEFGYRVAGSNGAYTFRTLTSRQPSGLPWATTNAIVFDVAANGLANNQSYEYVLVTTGTNAGVRQITSREEGTFYTGSSMSASALPQPIGGDGFAYMRQQGGASSLEFFDLGRGLAATSSVSSVSLKMRPAGSSDAWSSPVALTRRQAADAASAKDWWSFDWTGLSGNYEFIVEGLDDAGAVVSSVAGNMVLGSAPKVTSFSALQSQASTVTIDGEPANAQSVRIRWTYRDHSGSGEMPDIRSGELTLPRSGTGPFIWDASDLVPDTAGNFLYDYSIEAFDGPNGQGQLINKASGQVWLGSAAAAVGAPRQDNTPTLVTFVPAPGTPADAQLRVRYRLKPSDNAGATADDSQLGTGTRPYIELPATLPLVNGQFVWDASALNNGGLQVFEYVADLVDGSGRTYDRMIGTARIGSNVPAGLTQLHTRFDLSHAEVLISRSQGYNAFGEISYEIDGRQNRRDLSYNTLGLLTGQREAEVATTAFNGYLGSERAQTTNLYSLGGRLLSTTDANGNTTAFGYLANGTAADGSALLAWERHADRSIKQMSYDEFGQQRSLTNELGDVTRYDYDGLGRLSTLTRPTRAAGSPSALTAPASVHYEYDETGRQIAVTNELGFRSKTFYDAQGRVTRTVTAEGLVTATDYVYSGAVKGVGGNQVGGWVKTTTTGAGTADAHSLVEQVEYFGRTTYKIDLDNRTFNYTYDYAGHLLLQSGSNGQDIRYEYYANGYIKTISDYALGMRTSYGYDVDGNRTNEGYRSIGTALQPLEQVYESATIRYDARNRVTSVVSIGGAFQADISYEYDTVGNVRRILSNYKDGENGNLRVQDLWYTYDSMNRFRISQGQLSLAGDMQRSDLASANDHRGSIVVGTTGISLEYDATGQRRSAWYGSDNHVEDYSYTADGYLETVRIDGVLRSTRKNDAAGRVTEVVQYKEDGSWLDTTDTTYYRDNRTNQVVNQKGLGEDHTVSTTHSYYAADGTLTSTVQHDVKNGQDGATITNVYAYQWWDTAKQTGIHVYGDAENVSGWKDGFTSFEYDVNGHTKRVIDKEGIGPDGNKRPRELDYLTDAQGQVLRRDENVGGELHRWRQYYYLNGDRIGDVSNDGPSREDYAQVIARQQDTRSKDQRYRDWKPIYSADFDQNYEPISPDYPGGVSSSYTVQAGDTLQGIAAALWGDGQMWYLLADANGLSGKEALTEGQVLVVPNKVTNIHHTADTKRVYNPGEALGDVQPTLPPAPPPSDGCGSIGQVIMIAIAVVVTVYTGGVAASALATAMGTTLTAGTVLAGVATVAGAAIGAAAGSIASQGFGMAAGLQNDFSWNAVGQSALAGAVSAGVGFSEITNGLGSAAGIGAANAAISAGLTLAIKGDWDWRQIAGSAIGGALGGSKGAPGDFSNATTFSAAATALVSRYAGNWLANRVAERKADPRNAFLQTVGQSVGDYISDTYDLRKVGVEHGVALAGALGFDNAAAARTYGLSGRGARLGGNDTFPGLYGLSGSGARLGGGSGIASAVDAAEPDAVPSGIRKPRPYFYRDPDSPQLKAAAEARSALQEMEAGTATYARQGAFSSRLLNYSDAQRDEARALTDGGQQRLADALKALQANPGGAAVLILDGSERWASGTEGASLGLEMAKALGALRSPDLSDSERAWELGKALGPKLNGAPTLTTDPASYNAFIALMALGGDADQTAARTRQLMELQDDRGLNFFHSGGALDSASFAFGALGTTGMQAGARVLPAAARAVAGGLEAFASVAETLTPALRALALSTALRLGRVPNAVVLSEQAQQIAMTPGKLGQFDAKIANYLKGLKADGKPNLDAVDRKSKILEAEAAVALRDDLIAFGRVVPNTRVPFQEHYLKDGKFAEVDLETYGALIEVTIGRSSKATQIREKYSNQFVNPEGKPIILLAPDYNKAGMVRGAIDAGATAVVRTIPELVEYLNALKAQSTSQRSGN